MVKSLIKLKVEFYKNGNLKTVELELATDAVSAVARTLGVAVNEIKSISKR